MSGTKQGSLLDKLARPGGVRAVEVALAKAPERYLPSEAQTSKTSNKFRPWEVMLTVVRSSLQIEPTREYIYLRAENPQTAVHIACSYWRKWERLEKGVSDLDKYPDYLGMSETTCLDDGDYASAWRDAQLFPHRFVGEKDNPTAFTFYPPADISPRLIG